MARLIDADALIAWIKGSQQMTSKMKCVIAKIETMPDAVSVVHGEWKVSCKDSVCSVCGKDEAEFICGTEDWYGYGLSNFCPNCGAKMKGADDEV